MAALDSLPSRPLRPSELASLRESDGVVEAAPLGRTDDEVRHFALQVGEYLYGVGYRDGGWAVVERRVAGDPGDLAAVRDALRAWAAES